MLFAWALKRWAGNIKLLNVLVKSVFFGLITVENDVWWWYHIVSVRKVCIFTGCSTYSFLLQAVYVVVKCEYYWLNHLVFFYWPKQQGKHMCGFCIYDLLDEVNAHSGVCSVLLIAWKNSLRLTMLIWWVAKTGSSYQAGPWLSILLKKQ